MENLFFNNQLVLELYLKYVVLLLSLYIEINTPSVKKINIDNNKDDILETEKIHNQEKDSIVENKFESIKKVNLLNEYNEGDIHPKAHPKIIDAKPYKIKKYKKITLKKEDALYKLLNKISNNIEIENKLDLLENKLKKIEEKESNNEINLENNSVLIKENINSINEKMALMCTEKKDSPSITLLDILNETYRGINITLSLTNSGTLTGEVLKIEGQVLIIKANAILYYIDKDKIVYFY